MAEAARWTGAMRAGLSGRGPGIGGRRILTAGDATPAQPGAVAGAVRGLLRAEGLLMLALALIAYGRFGEGWGFFAAVFLLPDIAFLAYLAGPRAGALAYNATHSTIGPMLAGAAGALAGAPLLLSVGLVWAAHVGFDRALGWGLKYARGFAQTHLGPIGRPDPW